jgi:hypothetical protein
MTSTTKTQFIRNNGIYLKNTNFENNLKSSSSMVSNLSLSLPPNSGNTGEFLKTDGSGITSWSAAIVSGTGATGATGPTGIARSIGFPGPTGQFGPSSSPASYLYVAATATTAVISNPNPNPHPIPMTQYSPTSSGITWNGTTATVVTAGIYMITFYASQPLKNITMLRINGVDNPRYGIGADEQNTSVYGQSYCMTVIVSLNANDTFILCPNRFPREYPIIGTGIAASICAYKITDP